MITQKSTTKEWIEQISKTQKADKILNAIIENPLPTKLNKLKKSNIEAFFYWWEVFEIEKDKENRK